MKFDYWKSSDKVKIVYSVKDTIIFNGKEYLKAFVVESDNEKQMKTAINWANNYGSTDPIIIETDNKNFEIQIAETAGYSSQGGKLSFWTCIITKPGIDSFAIGINSNLLCALIRQSIMTNGKCNEKVIFARQANQLGVLHIGMSEYKSLLNDTKLRENKNKHKTSKWKVGYEYITLTQSDTFLGMFDDIIQVDISYNRKPYNIYFDVDFNRTKKPVYTTTTNYKTNTTNTLEELIKNGLIVYGFKDSCPSRQQGKQIFTEDENLNDKIFNIIYNIIVNKLYDICYLNHIPTYAFSLYTRNPEYTIKILECIKDKIEKDMYSMQFEYENTSIMKPILATVHFNEKDKTFTNYLDLYNYLIDIAKTHI